MNRRGHLSSKIPNVKLRPAPRRSSRRLASPEPSDAEVMRQAWDEPEEEAGPSHNSNRPWRGITVTFTGVDNKQALSGLVRELGGEIESALTVDVTHIVAVGFTSAKYHYAVEHRIPVLSPSWIEDAHKRWVSGENLDIRASIEAHKLQPFLGCKISISGIDQLDRRKAIIKWINECGGTYSRDLDRTCTHLVSAFTTTDLKAKKSDKIKWAVKEISDRAGHRRRGKKVEGEDICIVYEQWIWDCVGYGGRWKEELYDARKPRRRPKVDAEDVLDGTAFIIPEPEPPAPKEEKEDDELVNVRKRKHEEDGIQWLANELLSTSKPVETPASELPTEVPVNEDDVEMERRPEPIDRKASYLHASRSTSFAAPAAAGPSRLNAPPAAATPKAQVFAGLTFSHAIPEGYQGLEGALTVHGGVLVPESERLAGAPVDYVIIRLSSSTRPPADVEGKPPTLVTECWVEGCCFEGRLLNPEDNLVFQPLNIDTPVAGTDSLLVHFSGFPTETSVYLRRLLKAVGGTLSEKLNRRTTHLVCKAPQGHKYDKATEWGVTVVRESWMWTIGQTGIIEPPEMHSHTGGAPGNTSVMTANMSTISNLPDDLLSGTSLPPTRQLKPTPTHVDRTDRGPLSPPNPATERLLNLARRSPAHASAPESTPPRSSPKTADLKATATIPGGVLQGSDMTAALRRLAERDAPQRSAKLIRRSRPRKSGHDATPATGVSPTTSPVKPDPQGPLPMGGGVQDESMRVTYADPVSEKERRRLLDAVMRGGVSPNKRTRM